MNLRLSDKGSQVQAPASVTASSSITATAAVRNTASKCLLTSSLLRLKATMGPRPSLTITGANNDQRANSHKPVMTSMLAAAVGSVIAATEPAITSGTKGAARSRWLFPLRFAELLTD
jgi:hypothetical protein